MNSSKIGFYVLKTVVTTSLDREAKVWNAKARKVLVLLEDQHSVRSARFSFDGMKVVTTNVNGTVKVWDAETGKVLDSLKNQDTDSVQFSLDGKKIVMVSNKKTVKVWDVTSETLTPKEINEI